MLTAITYREQLETAKKVFESKQQSLRKFQAKLDGDKSLRHDKTLFELYKKAVSELQVSMELYVSLLDYTLMNQVNIDDKLPAGINTTIHNIAVPD